MSTSSFQYLFLILITVLVNACAENEEHQLVIAAAANTQFAIRELAAVFEKETNISPNLVISSSGKLTAQIKEGAPYHLFISANMKYPEELYRAERCLEPPKVYAYGKLVLWTHQAQRNLSIAALEAASVQHIAIANPKTAPYGEAAVEVLKHYQLLESLEEKLVYGESISQTNQFILSGTADLGFTAQSVVVSPELLESGSWVRIDTTLYSPIAQGVVVIKQKDQRQLKAARQFYDFLDTPLAQAILRKYGYQVTKQ